MVSSRRQSITAAAHMFATGFSYRLGAYPLPRMAHLYLEIEDERDRWPPLDLETWLLVFRRLSRLDVLKVLGRDPFDRPDLPDLIRGIREEIQPTILQLNTSAEHPEKTCQILRKTGWPGLHLRVGIQSWPPKESTLEMLKRLLVVRRKRGFQLGLNVHVTSKCRDDLDLIQSWCTKRKIGFFPGIPVNPVLFRETPETLESYRIDNEDIEAVARSTASSQGSGYGRVLRHFLSLANQQTLWGLSKHGPCQKFSCQELSALAYILPNGNVVSCGLRTGPVGDLTTQDLSEIWYSPAAYEARRSIRSCSGCFQASIQLMSQLYGGDWMRVYARTKEDKPHRL